LFEAEYYDKKEGKNVQCLLCPRNCIIQPGTLGNCQARKNIDGKLYALGYSRFTSVHADPIEKKPVYHYKPGSSTMSFGTAGCNLHCAHCQNWSISQISAESNNLIQVTPQNAIEMTRKNKCETIAYTYNEPLINWEWIRDTGKLAHEINIGNILVSNGLINPKPLEELLPIIDAANVDIKAFTEEFYKEVAGFPGLKHIKQNVIKMWSEGVHIELTMLLIPDYNDSPEEIKEFSQWVLNELDENVPIHFSRFYPHYKMQHVPPTPVDTVIEARRIAEEEGLNFVYTGNLPYSEINTTFCLNCGQTLVERVYYNVKIKQLSKTGNCKNCGVQTPIKY
jgi:pyruvate formate lyase activating enzyme